MARYTIELGKEVEQHLAEVAKLKALTKAEVIRRALATYIVITEETALGNRISIGGSKSGETKELIAL